VTQLTAFSKNRPTMSIPTVNYREIFFEHPDLSKIIGVPSYDTLHTLNQEIKSNAISVHSNLGGGQHGHLGLVISPNAYAFLADIPYVRPGHPAPLDVPVAATRHQQDLLERTYKEALRLFHEVRGVERALMQQIVSAVEPQYLTAMRNRTTGQFNVTIFQLLHNLLTVYGKITPSQLLQLEQETKTFTYDPVTPVDVVFNKVEDLVEYGEMAQCDFTMPQTINIAYAILNRTTKFRESIKAWNRRPALQKTWIAFKIHFREAHTELQETGELSMEDAGYHQANLVEAIANRVAELQTVPAYAPAPSSEPDNAILPILAQMQQMMAAMQTAPQPARPSMPAESRTRGAPRPPPTGPRTGQPSRPLPPWATKYCWTHGKCAHDSMRCNNRAPGHQESATMEDKQGGSTFGCT
jgi:hypothetical protein